MTLAVRGVVELFRIVKREKELHREILAFSAGFKIAPVMDSHEFELRLKECQGFLQKNANIDCGDEIQPADGNTVEKGTHHDSICIGAL
jgi:hypothetical protein